MLAALLIKSVVKVPKRFQIQTTRKTLAHLRHFSGVYAVELSDQSEAPLIKILNEAGNSNYHTGRVRRNGLQVLGVQAALYIHVVLLRYFSALLKECQPFHCSPVIPPDVIFSQGK